MDTDQAFDMLKKAGITDSIETFRRWLREGKIKATGFKIDDKSLKMFINERTYPDKDEIIRQLKLKIKAKDEHIEGIEELHENATKLLIKQRDKLHKEIAQLKNEKNNLRKETIDLLKENIGLRDELIEVKEKLLNGSKSDSDHFHFTSQSKDYNKKLGLSKMASTKEVLAGYKELLKVSHPDHGGNAKAFHYIKTDYDDFRNSIKG